MNLQVHLRFSIENFQEFCFSKINIYQLKTHKLTLKSDVQLIKRFTCKATIPIPKYTYSIKLIIIYVILNSISFFIYHQFSTLSSKNIISKKNLESCPKPNPFQ